MWEKLVGRALLSKALIQLSVDEWGCTASLVAVWPKETQSWASRLCGRINEELQEGLSQGGPCSAPTPVVSPC